MTDSQAGSLADRLVAPFGVADVKFKPAVVSNGQALALAYVSARAIQDRLDSVFGPGGWQDEYDCLPSGSVVCRLRCLIEGTWVTKCDVGSPSEQPDEGDRTKAAFSDALKRAAVKFGIGRYLYRLPTLWAAYDKDKRRFTASPTLPAWAVPATITTEDGAELQRLIKEHGIDWSAVAARYQITRLGELPAMHLDDARRFITSHGKPKGAANGTAA